MATIINTEATARIVQNAIKGIVDRIVKEETEKAKDVIQQRIFADVSSLTIEVVKERMFDSLNSNISIVVIDGGAK